MNPKIQSGSSPQQDQKAKAGFGGWQFHKWSVFGFHSA
jgi:hypothetical protein